MSGEFGEESLQATREVNIFYLESITCHCVWHILCFFFFSITQIHSSVIISLLAILCKCNYITELNFLSWSFEHDRDKPN